jgi:glycine cleavage system H protein
MNFSGCEFPDSLLYDPDGWLWARRDGEGMTVGVIPALAWLSGGFTTVSVKAPGSRIATGSRIASLEGPRHFDVARAPFECEVLERNPSLSSSPMTVARDPFGAGWLAVVEQNGASSSLKPLPECSSQMARRVEGLGVRCFSAFPDREMYEIGVECSAVLVRLNDLLAVSPHGTVVHLVSDDPTSDVEMVRWEDQTGNRVLESLLDRGMHHFVVRKE